MDDNYIPKHAKLDKIKESENINSEEINDAIESAENIDLDEISNIAELSSDIDLDEISDIAELSSNIDLNETSDTVNLSEDIELDETNADVILSENIDSDETNDDVELSKNIDVIKEKDVFNSASNISSTIDPDFEELSHGLKRGKKKKSKRKKTKKFHKILWILLLLFFITTLAISVSKLLNWNKDNKETKDIIDNIQNNVEIKELVDDENTELVNADEDKTSDYWYYTTFSLINVDIAKLKEKNKDTIGWITVNNTNINYPYVQTTDNSFYLNHSYDKVYNDAGWVFMDYRNSSNLNNKNTILYAHSRLDKTMFGSLSKTLKSNWYTNKDNHIIRISTETENSLWQIFSVYKIEEESYYITTNFSTDAEYQTFLDTIKSRSIYNFNTTLTTNDKILTLSTCYSDTVRTVVHAKLIKKSTK